MIEVDSDERKRQSEPIPEGPLSRQDWILGQTLHAGLLLLGISGGSLVTTDSE